MTLSFGARGRQRLCLAVVSALLTAGASVSAEQAAPQLFVASAVPQANGASLTISGGNFGASGGMFGTRPFVTLDLVPLDIRAATDTVILAATPAGTIPPGTYLLTVSRGPTPADNASVEVTVGARERLQADITNNVPSAANAPGSTTEASKSLAEPLAALPEGHAPAAQIGDRVIAIDEIDREWRRSDPSNYLQVIRQLYEARRQVVNAMVTDELLSREAASRGVSVATLLAEEIPKRVIAMPDSAVISLFVSLGASARGASLGQMKPALRAWLERHSELEIAKMSFVEELKKVSTRADILLDAPRVRVERTTQDIALGSPAAPVEIVAFGDFQNAGYARLAQVFPRIRDTFGDRVRLVFKNLPTLGPQSVAAAEAALCAPSIASSGFFESTCSRPGQSTPANPACMAVRRTPKRGSTEPRACSVAIAVVALSR